MDINFDDVVELDPPYTAISFTKHERITSSMNAFGTVVYGHTVHIRLHVHGLVDSVLVPPPEIHEEIW